MESFSTAEEDNNQRLKQPLSCYLNSVLGMLNLTHDNQICVQVHIEYAPM